LDDFGRVDAMGFRPTSELAPMPDMMYLPRVNAQTQFKIASLKLRENTINENPRTWYVICWL